jgi:DNA replication protein DnaC
MHIQTIKSQLRALRLPTAAKEIDEVIANNSGAVDLSWFCDLLQRELDQRRENTVQARVKACKFKELTTIEGFDFNFNPNVPAGKIREIAQISFLDRRQIALFLGPPGTGKTHIAIAIGYQAIQAGRKVYCSTAKKLASDISIYKQCNNLDTFFKRILSCDLWIIDDWAVVSMTKSIAEEVFDLMDRRKSHAAMIVTSNRDVSEWQQVFPDAILAQATIDRIFDRAEILVFPGNSYRLGKKIELEETISRL